MAANKMWQFLSADALAYVRWNTSSCIGFAQVLSLACGQTRTAEEILHQVQQGERIDFTTTNLTGDGECRNPVIGAVHTRAPGVRIEFTDGRTVEVTIGHVLPVREEFVEDWGDRQISEQMICFAGDVRAGMILLDGEVAEVHDIGEIDAVRLWTAHPAWIQTDQGVRIGTRWHEVGHAWCVIDQSTDDVEDFRVTRASGWVWVTPATEEGVEPQLLTQREGEYLDYDSCGELIPLAQLGEAWTVKTALKQRGHMTLPSPHWFGEHQELTEEGVEPLPFNAMPAKAHLALVWSRPADMNPRLVGGVETVGDAALYTYEALPLAAVGV